MDPSIRRQTLRTWRACFIAIFFILGLGTKQVRSRPYVFLWAGAIYFLACLSIYLIYAGSFSINPIDWYPLVRIVFFILTTGAIAVNFILNILEIAGIIPTQNTPKSVPKVRKKKYPKRRKDYK